MSTADKLTCLATESADGNQKTERQPNPKTATCSICNQPIGPKDPSYERVETWTQLTGRARGNRHICPKLLKIYAHASCVDSAKRGFQGGLFET